jgi:DNA-binding response OmpR family regulator
VTPPSRVLIFGHDSALIETRRLLLLHTGFDVIVALDLRKTAELLATRSFDLFILCHSLPLKDCEGALALAHSLHSGLKNLILDAPLEGCSGRAEDTKLSAFVDPQTLIDTLNQLSDHPVSNP